MRRRMIFGLLLMTAAVGPASAQQERGGVRTETEGRMAGENSGYDIIWNAIGLLGLLGLIGLLPQHEEDSYHPAPIE